MSSKKDPLDAIYGNSKIWNGTNGTDLIALNKKKKTQSKVKNYGYKKCQINGDWEFDREYYDICKQDQFGKLLNLVKGDKRRFKKILTFWQSHIQGARYRKFAPYKKRKWTESEVTILHQMDEKFKEVKRILNWWLYYSPKKDRRDWFKKSEELNLKEMKYKDHFLNQLKYIEDNFLNKFKPILDEYYGRRK